MKAVDWTRHGGITEDEWNTEAALEISTADNHQHPSRQTPPTESTALVGSIQYRDGAQHDGPRCG